MLHSNELEVIAKIKIREARDGANTPPRFTQVLLQQLNIHCVPNWSTRLPKYPPQNIS
jgi:hypothetical protein